jgi:hypothetical protein
MFPIRTVILFLFISISCISQALPDNSRSSTDSLKRLLPEADTRAQVDILNNLAYLYAPVNFDSSIIFSSRAARLAIQTGYEKGLGLSRYNTGNAYYFRLDFRNALLSYLSAQSVLEPGDYQNELGEICLMLGHINFYIMRGEKAVSYYRKALTFFQESGNNSSFSKTVDAMGLAMSFLTSNPVDSALRYGYMQLNYARLNHEKNLEARALSDIGMFYSAENKSVPKKQMALVYCDSAIRLGKSLNFKGLLSVVYLNLGGYYDRSSPLFEVTGNLPRARLYYDSALVLAESINSIYLQALILNYLAEIDIEEGKYDMAARRLDRSQSCLDDFFSFEWKETPVDVVNSLGKIFEYFVSQRERNALYSARFKLEMARGEYKKAVESQTLYYQWRDTMYASQQGRQFELMIAEDEAEKQVQKINNLAQENELNQLRLSRSRLIFLGAGATIILVSLILLLFFQRKGLRAERRSVMMEQRLLRAQMNPHFIFNSLASIQNFVINENSDQASIYLSRFSQLVRNILDNSIEDYVPLDKEIETIENYLELQKVRYAGKFDHEIGVDDRIDRESTLIPPMLAQPFIENAIEHGIRHKDSPGRISIRFRLTDGLIRFEVEDDGVGRERAKEIEHKQGSRHRSMATSITHDRLKTLNRKLKKKIRMEIIDLKDASGKGCGTRVEFGIPVVVR